MSAADEATEGLIRASADDVLAYFERRVEQREDAGDLLADTLVVVWRRRRLCPADLEQQRMWLFTIARNVLSNHRRGVTRRHALGRRLREQLAVMPARCEPPDGSEVLDAVRALPEDLRELVMLVHWDGFTLAEAGRILGIGASTARSRHAGAKARLRGLLGASVKA
jgi:RNA polymerase sigma-70 factor, ECF subfamily